MQNLFDELRERGCDMEATMERFLNDENFYVDCLKDALYDEGFEKLGEALKAEQATESFEYAHMLKGIVANMGLTSMFDTLVKIVEPLRKGETAGLMGFYEDLITDRDSYRKLLPVE